MASGIVKVQEQLLRPVPESRAGEGAGAAALADDWYLLAYGMPTTKRFAKRSTKFLLFTLSFLVLFGATVFALSKRSEPSAVVQIGWSQPSAAASATEIPRADQVNRLEARNRRLEALVAVLRQRTKESGKHSKDAASTAVRP